MHASKMVSPWLQKKKPIEHHAIPRRASATSPLRTGVGADMCKRGACIGSRAGAKTKPESMPSSHERTEDQARRGTRANVDTAGGR